MDKPAVPNTKGFTKCDSTHYNVLESIHSEVRKAEAWHVMDRYERNSTKIMTFVFKDSSFCRAAKELRHAEAQESGYKVVEPS